MTSAFRPLCLAAVALVVIASLGVGRAGASHVAPFVGTWLNDDAMTQSQTRAVVAVEGSSFQVYGYGACVPTDCDWAGSVGGPRTTPQSDANDGQLSVTWDFGFKTMTQTLVVRPGGGLHITSVSHYNDGRPDLTTNEDFHRTTAPMVFFALTVNVSGTGNGKVTSSPAGIACPLVCSLEFQRGSTVTLTAEPAPGSKLASWTGPCTVNGLTCTTSLGADADVTAVFRRSPPCIVPDLRRKTLARARSALAAAHCRLGTVSRAYSARVTRGLVISQSMQPRKRLRNGAKVGLVLSRGSRP